MKNEGSIQERRQKRYDQDDPGDERAWYELRDDREMHGSGRDRSPVPCEARVIANGVTTLRFVFHFELSEEWRSI